MHCFEIHQAGQIEPPIGPVLALGPYVWHPCFGLTFGLRLFLFYVRLTVVHLHFCAVDVGTRLVRVWGRFDSFCSLQRHFWGLWVNVTFKRRAAGMHYVNNCLRDRQKHASVLFVVKCCDLFFITAHLLTLFESRPHGGVCVCVCARASSKSITTVVILDMYCFITRTQVDSLSIHSIKSKVNSYLFKDILGLWEQ